MKWSITVQQRQLLGGSSELCNSSKYLLDRQQKKPVLLDLKFLNLYLI